MGITHPFISTNDQGDDASLVSKNEWNADHVGDFLIPASGAGVITIPGSWAVDSLPAYPSEWDDEFDSSSLSSWTTLGTLDVCEANVIPSHLRIKRATGVWDLDGIYKACPPMPFTVTVKISDMLLSGVYQNVGPMLLEASPGKILQTGCMYWTSGSDNAGYGVWASRTSRTSWSGDVPLYGARARYRRFVVTSSTKIAVEYSVGGMVWAPIFPAVNPGFTVANVGIFVCSHNNAQTVEAMFDWIRFTRPTFTVDAVIA